MLGWHITIARQKRGGAEPARFDEDTGDRLAVWQAGVSGLDWLDELVKQGKAVFLGGNGYPTAYTAPLCHLIEPVRAGPPVANPVWLFDEGDVLTPKWLGRTTLFEEAIRACDPQEWVHVQVWDES